MRCFLFMPSYSLGVTPYELLLLPTFCQIKDLIKIHIRGNFYKYSICGCEVQRLSYLFSIHEIAPFWSGEEFRPLCPQIMFDPSKILTRGIP